MILFQETSGSGDARHRIAKRARHSVRCIEQARELLFLSQHIIDIALSCGIRFQPRHTSAFKRTNGQRHVISGRVKTRALV